jgi:hypothetical protein
MNLGENSEIIRGGQRVRGKILTRRDLALSPDLLLHRFRRGEYLPRFARGTVMEIITVSAWDHSYNFSRSGSGAGVGLVSPSVTFAIADALDPCLAGTSISHA